MSRRCRPLVASSHFANAGPRGGSMPRGTRYAAYETGQSPHRLDLSRGVGPFRLSMTTAVDRFTIDNSGRLASRNPLRRSSWPPHFIAPKKKNNKCEYGRRGRRGGVSDQGGDRPRVNTTRRYGRDDARVRTLPTIIPHRRLPSATTSVSFAFLIQTRGCQPRTIARSSPLPLPAGCPRPLISGAGGNRGCAPAASRNPDDRPCRIMR